METGPALRRALESDLPALADLYAAAVRARAPARYTPEQVESWASFARDAGFRDFVLEAESWVACLEDRPVGFSGLAEDGRIPSLYVHPDHGRMGVGTLLLDRVLTRASERGLRRLHTEASLFSRPLFLRAGFQVEGEEAVERRGVTFTRWRMVRHLPPLPEGDPAGASRYDPSS